MNLSNRLLLTIWFTLQSLLCFSQSEQWINCLSHRQINDIIEYDNLMYVATTGGLIIYDAASESITNLNRATSDIPSNGIIDIEIDKDSTLWLMTDVGLCAYKDGDWQEYLDMIGLLTLDEEGYINVATKTAYFYWNENNFDSLLTYPDLAILELKNLIIDKVNGDIWITAIAGFAPDHIFKYVDNTWTDIDLGTFSYNVFDLAFDSNNQLWCITDRGFYKYEEQWVSKTELVEQQDNYYFTSLGADSDGNIFVSYSHPNFTSDNYIYKIDPEENVNRFIIPRENSRIRFTPTFLNVSDNNATILLGTINNGCLVYEDGSWSELPIEVTDFKTNFMSLSKTENNGIFIKSTPYYYYGNHQLYNYKDNSWNDLTNVHPFQDAYKFTVFFSEGLNQNSWMTFNDSLYMYEQDEWSLSSWPNIDQDINETKSEIYFDHEDSQWLLNKQGNYILYESDTGWKVFDGDQYGLDLNHYTSVFNHPVTKELWVSGYKGIAIYSYSSDQWRFLSFSSLGMPHSSFLSLSIDPNEDIITTQGQNIVRINEDTGIDTIASLFGYPELKDFSTTLVEQDTIWLGMNGGIAKFYNNHFEILDRSNSGIVNGSINGIVRDDKGNLWFSSSTGGLAIYNENGLSDDILIKDISSSVKGLDNSLSFDLFPNPFNTHINLKLGELEPNAELNIYNQYGQLIYNKFSITPNESIALTHLPSGLYFVEIYDPILKKKSIKKCVKI